jgi:group I intron endonuclease
LSLVPIVPTFKSYSNVDLQKEQIIKENKNKSGIYCFTNLVNGKQYIGSAKDLRVRLRNYFNKNYLTRCNNMYICRALLKYGYSNFSLEILEYYKPDDVIELEDKYIKLLKPEYNILQKAGNSLGFKHSETTRAKMRASKLGLKKSEETKLGMSFLILVV